MIPSFMDDRTPPGERDVFNLLAGGPDSWSVIHSLDLTPWNRGLRTEIDFVVIVPDTGILCIEVKSHEDISFDGQRWYPNSITRSPFKQASDCRHTFYRRLKELAPQFKRIPVVHCCIFPMANFDLPPNLSVQPWELIDLRTFRSFKSSHEFCRDLKARIIRSVSVEANLQQVDQPLTQDQIRLVVKQCVPIQRFCPDGREEIRHREAEIERLLINQQKPVLQLAEWNDRLIVRGGAGTGKTLIAMELARRIAENGKRVALLCYNRLVGEWMKRKMEQTRPPLPNLVVGRVISVLADMAGIRHPQAPMQDYWETTLPRELEERITDPDFRATASLDYLVLDEAQDILARPALWQCLLSFLSGNMEGGAFSLFGDFDHQVLRARENLEKAITQLNKASRPVQWKLSINCRNYRIVGDTAVMLAGLGGHVYSGYARSGGSVANYDIYFYHDYEDQLKKIGEYLKKFRDYGYKKSEITLLSFRSDNMSAAMQLRQKGFEVRPAWQSGEFTSFASVHSYKGMENKVIILTDVVIENLEFQRDLFYTGLTRAIESVRVLCDDSSKESILKWLQA